MGNEGKMSAGERADHPAEGDADQSAESGERHRFGEELPDDIAPTRANGFANADFAGALGDGHQHDVHDADAADEQADGTDGDN